MPSGLPFLFLLAIVPGVALLYYVWKKDKSKEPFKVLAILFLLGVVSCIPAALLEVVLGGVFSAIFGEGNYIFYFVDAFLGVALIEEGCKFVLMFLYTRKHKEFNGLFDGLIYAVFVSLGFATFENILYVVDNGFATGIMRAVTAVPGHMFFAVFMGFNYSMWHTYKLCDKSETYFANLGMIRPRPPKYQYSGYLVKAIVFPVLIHGLYDFLLFTENTVLMLLNFVLVIVLYVVCFGQIKKLSRADMEDYQLIPLMLCQKYPELVGIIMPRQANPMAAPASYYQNAAQQQVQQPTAANVRMATKVQQPQYQPTVAHTQPAQQYPSNNQYHQ